MRIILVLFLLIGSFLSSQGQEIKRHPDNSVTTAEFVSMGIPPVDKIWNAKDYQRAFHYLDKIHGIDKYSMPRISSKFSAELFKRLTAKENFDFLIDDDVDLQIRAEAMEAYGQIPYHLLGYYAEGNKERFGAEVMACFELTSHLTDRAVKLIHELKNVLGDQANTSDFKKGIDGLEETHYKTLRQMLMVYEEDAFKFDDHVVENFSQNLANLLPEVWGSVNLKYHDELKQRVKRISKNHKNKVVKKRMKRLFKKL